LLLFPLVSAANVSIFLITLLAPLSTVLKRTLDNARSRLFVRIREAGEALHPQKNGVPIIFILRDISFAN